jgi:hypothetical protein
MGDVELREVTLEGVLELDYGTEVAVPVASTGPASAGRIQMAFTIPGSVPSGARITAARIVADTGATFARWFVPYLNVPPGGTLTVTFAIEDMRAGW